MVLLGGWSLSTMRREKKAWPNSHTVLARKDGNIPARTKGFGFPEENAGS